MANRRFRRGAFVEELRLAPLIELTETVERLIETHLWLKIIIGMVSGVAVGMLISPNGLALVEADTARVLAGWCALPGQLFLALIQMVVIPLVISSIIVGVASGGDRERLKKVGVRIAPFFLITTIMAAAIGIAVGFWIQPGRYLDPELARQTIRSTAPPPAPAEDSAVLDLEELPQQIVAVVPTNMVVAVMEQSMLQLVVFAIFIGVALVSAAPARARPLLDLAGSIQEVAMQVVGWAMLMAPYAVFGLLCQITVRVGLEAILGMAVYVGAVLLGLVALMGLYLLIVLVAARRPPFRFLSQSRSVLLLAFSTSSSAAVMPLSIQTVQEKMGVRPSIANFVIPLGATVNMGGTALYQVVAAIFLTQVFDVPLTLGSLTLLTATTVGASIGSPSSPGAGIVILATILQSIGVPSEGVALIIGVDRILDMTRTSVNVAGDLTACVVMDRWLTEDAEPAMPAEAADTTEVRAAGDGEK